MNFAEVNTVEQMILDTFTKRSGEELTAHWDYVLAPDPPRHHEDVTVESWMRNALIQYY